MYASLLGLAENERLLLRVYRSVLLSWLCPEKAIKNGTMHAVKNIVKPDSSFGALGETNQPQSVFTFF